MVTFFWVLTILGSSSPSVRTHLGRRGLGRDTEPGTSRTLRLKMAKPRS